MRSHAKASSAGSTPNRVGRGALALAALSLLALVLWCAPALAGTVTTHQLSSSFDGTGSTPNGAFTATRSLAIDQQSGDVYVIDQNDGIGAGALDKFDADGNPQPFTSPDLPLGTTSLTGSNTPAGSFSLGGLADVAVDNSGGASQGNIYLAPDGGGVYAFDSTGTFLWHLDNSNFGENCGVATDSAGHLWVADYYGSVKEFDNSGAPPAQIGQIPLPPGFNACRVALDGNGNLYVGSPYGGHATEFDSSGAQIGTIGNDAHYIAIDPVTNDVFTNELSSVSQFNPAGDQLDQFSISSNQDGYSTPGLAVNKTSGDVYASLGQSVGIFPPTDVTTADISAIDFTNVTINSATLNATINPQGFPTTYRFEYRKHGDSKWTLLGDHDIGSGSSDIQVSDDLSGLDHTTQYDVRIVVVNSDTGFTRWSPRQILTTADIPPVVDTIDAGALQQTSVRLGGLVNPNGAPTTYYFEWGADTGYGNSVPVAQNAGAGSGSNKIVVTQNISGLQPDTTYHFRLVASNDAGTVLGDDKSVKTVDPDAAPLGQRGIELVTPPDKGNQNPQIGSFETSPVSLDGNRVIWSTPSGAPGSTTGTHTLFLSTRTSSGWQSKSLIPPAEEQLGGGELAYYPLSNSPDLSRFVLDVTEGFLTNTVRKALVTLDDQGNQREIVPLHIGAVSEFAGNYTTNRDATDVYYRDGANITDYHDGTDELLKTPACGFEGFHPNADGTRIFFSSAGDTDCGAPTGIYMLDNTATPRTLTLISGPQTDPAGLGKINPSGTEAIYTTAGVVYLWREGSGSVCFSWGQPPQGSVSPSLSHIYGVPAPAGSEVDSSCDGHTNTICPIYVLRDGQVKRVTERSGGFGLDFPFQYSSTSDDGRFFFFIAATPGVTADDPGTCFNSSEQQYFPCRQLYRYDDVTSRVLCISCNGTLGPVPGHIPTGSAAGYFATPDGTTVVFQDTGPLLPEDINGRPDIYEWHDGTLRLLTDGEHEWGLGAGGSGAPELWGISEDATNVIFTVGGAGLTGAENDLLANLYDARIGGGFPVQTPPAHCVEDACQGPLQSPPTGGDVATLDGTKPGNPPVAVGRQHHKHKRHQKHKRHHRAHGSTSRKG